MKRLSGQNVKVRALLRQHFPQPMPSVPFLHVVCEEAAAGHPGSTSLS